MSGGTLLRMFAYGLQLFGTLLAVCFISLYTSYRNPSLVSTYMMYLYYGFGPAAIVIFLLGFIVVRSKNTNRISIIILGLLTAHIGALYAFYVYRRRSLATEISNVLETLWIEQPHNFLYYEDPYYCCGLHGVNDYNNTGTRSFSTSCYYSTDGCLKVVSANTDNTFLILNIIGSAVVVVELTLSLVYCRLSRSIHNQIDA